MMNQPTPTTETIALAEQIRQTLVGQGLHPSIAKLYSQHTRLLTGQPGLGGWRNDEAAARLDDAVRLLEAGLIEREAGRDQWTESVRRVGEILEWLAHPELNPDQLPLRLLAAAAYQLAGYPARASGLLNAALPANSQGIPESQILNALLRSDFPDLLRKLSAYWTISSLDNLRSNSVTWQNADETAETVQEIITRETASALGILCAFMRWKDTTRLEKALSKIRSISQVMLYGSNSFSWLLAHLCAEVAADFVKNSLQNALGGIIVELNENGQKAIESYIKFNYASRRSLVWPSQLRGINRLSEQHSFALCTPTGSGKTTIAEIAILQNLFPNQSQSTKNFNTPVLNTGSTEPLVIYMVPSRALAAEVEGRLSRVFRRIGEPVIVVTGLYGGTDWGPTDAWLTADTPTVLICTYEKTEALIRFLGPLFLRRVSLIVIDEAHKVQFDGDASRLRMVDSRALRIEALCARLFGYLDEERGRVIALSAVASGFEQALSDWVTGTTQSSPTSVAYRSTRQLVGRLVWANGRYEILYDLLDNNSLKENTPSLPDPFPSLPGVNPWANKGPEKRVRAHVLWAAMKIAEPDQYNRQSAVLISVTQRPGWYAEDFLTLLENTWVNASLPNFFRPPAEEQDEESYNIWNRSLQSCEDYYGTDSREYRLLQKGIVVHHGKMPGLMARTLIELIRDRIVHIVLATSTLSEGVNLPFETVLIPTLMRGQNPLSLREFSNLIGRAGRPGVSTEGRSLIFIPTTLEARDRSERRAQQTYFSLVNRLSGQQQQTNDQVGPQSPLAELLAHIEDEWKKISGSTDRAEFIQWLEVTSPTENQSNQSEMNISRDAFDALDSLDNILLSALVELEQGRSQSLNANQVEEHLRGVWRRTYARFANRQEEELSKLFIGRGQAIQKRIYPDPARRRRLYRTNLPPRSGEQLLVQYPAIQQQLETGVDYAEWDIPQRLAYITRSVALIRGIDKFRGTTEVGRGRNASSWEEILAWWMARRNALRSPTPQNISDWHNFISNEFTYRFNWGLGSVVALAMDEAFEGNIQEPSLESWPLTGLPWVVFWMKELIIWGTLDPVAAYLLARGNAATRDEAENRAQDYYKTVSRDLEADEHINASTIRDWAANLEQASKGMQVEGTQRTFQVRLLRDFSKSSQTSWKVIPVATDSKLYWLDPGGFPFAISDKPENWRAEYLDRFDFILDTVKNSVVSARYI